MQKSPVKWPFQLKNPVYCGCKAKNLNAISIGGDSDTIAAIAGSIAEAFYGVDPDLQETALSFLDDELLDVATKFMKKFMTE